MKTLFLLLISTFAYAQRDTINIYGPGGPYPPVNEIAKIFTERNGLTIRVTKGPVSSWKSKAMKNADIIYSGSEFMMTDFIADFPMIQEESVFPLYLRRSGLLVRPGNPKEIRKLTDILKPGIKVMVVSGAGLTGVWEDITGKTRNIDSLRMLKKNIILFARNSGEALTAWLNDEKIDVWISWNTWQVANARLADFVSLDERYTSYRDCGIALTGHAMNNKNALDFFDYLKSEDAKLIFKKWGWIVE